MSDGVIRNRFLELCKHLKNKKTLLKFTIEHFDSEVEQMTVDNGGQQETEQGWHFANFRYRGMIYIERLPGETLALLALMIRAWLDEHDDTRNKYRLEQPVIETDDLGGGFVDVICEINFVDEVFLVESATGPIEWRGGKFDLGEYPVNYAEGGDIGNVTTG